MTSRLMRCFFRFGFTFVCLLVYFFGADRTAMAQTCGGWNERAFQNPDGRTSAASAYDSTRGVTILFGGRGDSEVLRDTWEWDGHTWARVSDSGPIARYQHVMAYDSARGVTVLFGGRGASTGSHYGDTWEWNGSQWTRVASSGPPSRESAAMVYDQARGVTVLFGGGYYSGSEWVLYNDTWEWNGATWTQVSSTGPRAVISHAMAYDADRGVTVLYGGQYYDVIWRRSNETWEWSGGTWTLRATGGPLSEAGHAMAYHAGIALTVMHGTGWNYTWTWDGSQWRRAGNSGPERRSEFSMSYDSRRDRTVLFGGNEFDDTWEFDGVEWRPLPGGTPTERSGMSMAFDANRSVAVMFGGGFDQFTHNETWEWDGQRWTLVPTGTMSLRERYGMAYDSDRKVTLMFGGEENDEWLYLKPPDTWAWNGAEWTRLATVGPPPRTELAMTYDSGRGVAVLAGGYDYSDQFDDTWEWNGATWTQVASGGIPPHYSAAMAYDAARGVSILFGGKVQGGYSGDTWQWDGRQWTRVATSGPAPRLGHVMAYDADHQVIIMFGGRDAARQFDDTWVWNGAAWSRVNATGPEIRAWPAMTYDSIRHEAILFGGYRAYQHCCRDTWTFRVPAPQLSLSTSCPAGGPATLDWSCATPLGRVAIVFAMQEGQVIIPSGPCAGTALGLGGNQIRLLATPISDGSGAGSISGAVPRQVCGTYLQLVDIGSCTTSNVARIE